MLPAFFSYAKLKAGFLLCSQNQTLTFLILATRPWVAVRTKNRRPVGHLLLKPLIKTLTIAHFGVNQGER